jgi:CRISPR system Cascade subunit CasA
MDPFSMPNYLSSRYLPVLCSDGRHGTIGPWEIAGTEDGRMPIAFAFADNLLNHGALELIAGLLQVLTPPASEREWRDAWRKAPGPIDLAASFAPYVSFFDLYGDMPAFQDSTACDAKEWCIDKMFHLSPGEITCKRNQDVFYGEIAAVSQAAAMVALYTMQSHAYQGGPGFRTSVAGGGPLRTIPEVDGSLYQRAWALVLPRPVFESLGADLRDPADVFPWISPRRGAVTTVQAPASHLYFAAPRRLLLGQATGTGECPLGGTGPTVSTVREAQDGPAYTDGGWRHPLTPYRRSLNGSKLTVSPMLAGYLAQGFSWRQRVGLVQDRNQGAENGIDAAQILTLWRSQRAANVLDGKVLRVQAYGVRCDQAKVLGLVHGSHPFRIIDPALAETFEALAAVAVSGAEAVQDSLRQSLRNALFPAREQETLRKQKKSDVMNLRVDPWTSAYWSGTEQTAADYNERVASLLEAGGDPLGPDMESARRDLHGDLVNIAVRLFDEALRDALLDEPDRVVAARQRVLSTRWRSDVLTAFLLTDQQEEVT